MAIVVVLLIVEIFLEVELVVVVMALFHG